MNLPVKENGDTTGPNDWYWENLGLPASSRISSPPCNRPPHNNYSEFDLQGLASFVIIRQMKTKRLTSDR
ncbi:hypothetical protein R1flu_005697 [Riccia fluitans]|uniref:Uncharacterized protein n=1 Tax=Riccia fluitans TaxID=41844 RepID=A0ABD1YTW9_9MARC